MHIAHSHRLSASCLLIKPVKKATPRFQQPAIMYSTGFPILPAIPTSIRNRLYSNRRTEPDRNNLNGDLHGGLASSSSEPHLLYHPKSAEPEASDIRRPKTASDDLDSFDSSSRKSGSPRVEDVGSPANYESASGLRWNRVIPGKSPSAAIHILFLADRLAV